MATRTLEYPHRIRVAHLVSGLDIGGLEKVVYDLVRFSDPLRFEVSVISLGTKGALASDFERLNVGVYPLNVLEKGPVARSRAVAAQVRALGIQVLHTHNPAPHIAGALARLRTRIPVLIHTKHGRNYPDQWRRVVINHSISRLTDRIVAVSDDAAQVARNVEKVSRHKLCIIRNGVDLQRFSASHSRRAPNRAIHVARICDPPKDHTTLLKAVRLVADAHADFHLDIVGDGPSRAAAESLCAELGLQSHVSFLGFCNDIPARLNACGLAVLSSLTEGLSITLLEAMAMELPIVATNVGGNPELVDDGVTGYLVPPQRPEEMANAIMKLLKDPGLSLEMGRLGRQRIAECFDLRTTAKHYSELYESALLARKQNDTRLSFAR